MPGCNTREENAADLANEEAQAQLRRPLLLDQRERDTIIAALRFWQRKGNGYYDLEIEIADNGREGPDSRLSDEEIDELIENRVNT